MPILKNLRKNNNISISCIDEYNYKVVKSNRKSMSIGIDDYCNITIRIPYAINMKQVEKFVCSKLTWINKQISIKKERLEKSHISDFSDGAKLRFLGQLYELSVTPLASNSIKIIGDKLMFPKKDFDNVTLKITNWYKKQFRTIVTERVNHYKDNHGFEYKDIRLSSAKTRWGSCSSKKSLNFNWRLVMAPIEVIDYIVVHELCHTVHLNHSKDFWNLVKSICPDYKKQTAWLTNHKLELFNI